MKKIITALINETVNEKLKEYDEIDVVMNDIQYQEGIIEALEINTDVEYIILSALLPGENSLKELIEKIKQMKKEIKIIIILEKENKELENYLLSKGNINIFYNNEVKIKEIAELIINKNKNEELELEIKKLKEIIMVQKIEKESENKINKFKQEISITEREKEQIEKEIEEEFGQSNLKNNIMNNKIIKQIISKIKKEPKENNCKTIAVTGIAGVGKSVFVVNLSKILSEKNKILIIDFDFSYNSIQMLFGIKYRDEQVPNNIENLTIKINSKIKLISRINKLFLKNKMEEIELIKLIKSLKEKYDFIIIDINNNEKYLNSIKEECDKIIFLTEPNILQIKKTKQILEKYINEINIQKDKIYILFNKIQDDSISSIILKYIFNKFNIIGEIDFIKNNNTLINQNMNSIFLENKIKNQYKKIARKISQNNKTEQYYLDKIINSS